MKIFFRYLLGELLKPFIFCMVATSALWIVADLFGTMDDFVRAGASWSLIFKFYGAQLPKMIEMTLPVSILFASLLTIIMKSRSSELIALQAGGMSPQLMFSPFLVLAGLATIFLFIISSWPATRSEAIRQEILDELHTEKSRRGIHNKILYVDPINHRTWRLGMVNTETNQAMDVEILQQTPEGDDTHNYFAQLANYKDGYWRLHNAKIFTYNDKNEVADQTSQLVLDLPQYSISPQELIFAVADPGQLTLTELGKFLYSQTSYDNARLAPYRTQFWKLIFYPSIVIILVLFAISMGTTHNRRAGAAAGVFNAIFVLLAFYFVLGFFLSLGGGDRFPPILAAVAGPLIFAIAGVLMVSWKFGWLWQARAWWIEKVSPWPFLDAQQADQDGDKLPKAARNLRLESLKLLLNKVTKQNPNYPE